MRQKLKTTLIAIVIALSFAGFALPTTSTADAKIINGDQNAPKTSIEYAVYQSCPSNQAKATAVDKNNKVTAFDCINGSAPETANPLWADMQNIVNALAAGVGVVVIGTIIVGGIQYTVAGDQSGKVEEAKSRIANGIFALVAFFLTYAFLQWLIPGGIFGRSL